HVGIYVGNGQMIDDPHTGAVVRYDLVTGSSSYVGAARPSLLSVGGVANPVKLPPVTTGKQGASGTTGKAGGGHKGSNGVKVSTTGPVVTSSGGGSGPTAGTGGGGSGSTGGSG